MAHDFVIGLGGNLGERERFLALGVTGIAALPSVHVTALSRVFESDSILPVQPRYLNAAARISCDLEAPTLLGHLLAIERSFGRVRDVRWGPRVLDLDILWADEPVRAAELTVPHAGLRDRAFALAPLLDVAPDLAADYAASLAALGGAPAVHGLLRLKNGSCECIASGSV